jgi:hypothetical protein
MVEPTFVRLLHDCDLYLSRQQILIDEAAVMGLPDGGVVAMEAALEQLARAVDLAWRQLVTEMEHGAHTRPARLDPGE